jgi:hypothetical protein
MPVLVSMSVILISLPVNNNRYVERVMLCYISLGILYNGKNIEEL